VFGILHFGGQQVNRAVSICFYSRAALLALKSYAVSSRCVYYSTGVRFRNWLCRTEFDGCGSLDTVVSAVIKLKKNYEIESTSGVVDY
jgi:hypothetical protein